MKYTIKVPVEDDNGKMTSLSIEISKEEHARIESTRLTANFPVDACADRIMSFLRESTVSFQGRDVVEVWAAIQVAGIASAIRQIISEEAAR